MNGSFRPLGALASTFLLIACSSESDKFVGTWACGPSCTLELRSDGTYTWQAPYASGTWETRSSTAGDTEFFLEPHEEDRCRGHFQRGSESRPPSRNRLLLTTSECERFPNRRTAPLWTDFNRVSVGSGSDPRAR